MRRGGGVAVWDVFSAWWFGMKVLLMGMEGKYRYLDEEQTRAA